METTNARSMVHMDREQAQRYIRNLPGGIHQCANDADLTLLSMSDSFLSMFGYTREEIDTLFQNRFMNMIYPADRGEMITNTRRQLAQGAELELEYRVLRRDGTPVWVLDKGRLVEDGAGGHCFYCLLVEIAERKQQEEELRLSLERHQVIMDQATDIIFEWDIPHDTLSFSSNWRKKFGYDPIRSDISGRIPLSENIHPNDIASFVKIMRDTAAGVPYSETEFRIRDTSGSYLWCRIRATAQYNPDGKPIKAVGVIVDIDTEKKQKQVLLDLAQRDALTGLYNKAAINSLVERRMWEAGAGPGGFQALMILDVDHFKTVNDTYGHLAGDSVLSDIAAVLKASTHSTDLAGRIGGDEFLVYLPEVNDEEAVRQKVEELLGAIGLITPDACAAPISCSIGVAVSPQGAADYYALYKCADQALYQQKKNGRSGAAFFGADTGLESVPCGIAPTAVGEGIVSEDDNVVDEGLAQYAFRTLYAALDIDFAIRRLLEIIGRSFDVSRVYVFENSEGGRSCSNTFEWCGDGVKTMLDKFQNVPYADAMGDYLQDFDKNGVFFCHDITTLHPDVYAVLAPQSVRAILKCAMLDEGKFVGYVGFDECRAHRSWDRRMVAAFKLTADVLSTFLIRLRQKQRLEQYEHKK